MEDPHKGAISILEDVPFDQEEITDISLDIVNPDPLVSCEHEDDVQDCVECYNANRLVTLQLTFIFKKYGWKEIECELLFQTTPQAMIDTITIKDDCGETEKSYCMGNTFTNVDEYFWCKKHSGEYSELKLSDIVVNSDWDVGSKPITLMKTGSKSLTLKEAKFTEL